MNRIDWPILVLTVLASAIASCDRSPAQPPVRAMQNSPENSAPAPATSQALAEEACVPASGAGPSIVEGLSNDETYRVKAIPNPSPLPANAMFSLEIEVTSADERKRPADLAIHVDAWMPDHAHGMNVTPVIEAIGDGKFVARGLLFHMPGKWQLFIDITSRGVVERSQFEIVLP